jgi:hypothetical protein
MNQTVEIIQEFEELTSKQELASKPWLLAAIVSHIYVATSISKQAIEEAIRRHMR